MQHLAAQFSHLTPYDRLTELKRQLQELKDHQKFSQVFALRSELTPRADPRPAIESRGPTSAISTKLDYVALSTRYSHYDR